MLIQSLAAADVLLSILLFFLIGVKQESQFLHSDVEHATWDTTLLDILIVNVVRGSLLWFLFARCGLTDLCLIGIHLFNLCVQ